MQKWEITARVSKNAGFSTSVRGPSASTRLWENKNREGKTDLDILRELGQNGWELVSASPITWGGTTMEVLFTFNRPIEG